MTIQNTSRRSRAASFVLIAACLPAMISAHGFEPQRGSVALVDISSTQSQTTAARTAIDAALRWVAQVQSADGSWDEVPVSSDGWIGDGGQKPHTVGCTGIALLALLADGNTPTTGPFKRVVAAGIEWLCAQQDPAAREASTAVVLAATGTLST